MKKEVFRWEIRKLFEGNKKFLWIVGIIIYLLLIFTQNYTIRNQTLQETQVEEMVSMMKKVLYGGMSFFHIALIIAVVSPVFSGEQDSNMYDAIRTAKYGRSVIVWVKLVAAFAVIMAWTILYNGFNYLFFNVVLGWNKVSALGTYWKMGILSQIFGNLAIVGICCLISVMTKSAFSSAAISILIIFLPIFIPDNGIQGYLKYFPIWSVQLETCREVPQFAVILIADAVIVLGSIFLIRMKKWKWV
ncbi:MAG: ABC transporter permease subunit [Muribaculaceae bacterium]|nr:ABC transporter permease subunit [Muribaculaceae bacterium]